MNVRMSRPIKLFSGGNTNIFDLENPWLDVTESTFELWIDLSIPQKQLRKLKSKSFENVDRVVFYDWYDTYYELPDIAVKIVKLIEKQCPTVWYTLNKKTIPGINTPQIKFDFLWNRCKSAYLDKKLGWKLSGNINDYLQYPMHKNLREYKYLNLYRRPAPFRTELKEFLKKYNGFSSDVINNSILPGNHADIEMVHRGLTMLPARQFLDNSYVSCQIESQYQGNNSIVFTEKTYDHLIQGRIVLNFGPCGFYQALQDDGWQLPTVGIDLSWDTIENTSQRFQAYLDSLDQLFSKSITELHELFLANYKFLEHNYNMLTTKSYDYIQ